MKGLTISRHTRYSRAMKMIKCAMRQKRLNSLCCSALTSNWTSEQSALSLFHTQPYFEGKVQQFFKIPLSCHSRMEARSLWLGIGAVVGVNRLVSDPSGSLLTAFPLTVSLPTVFNLFSGVCVYCICCKVRTLRRCECVCGLVRSQPDA